MWIGRLSGMLAISYRYLKLLIWLMISESHVHGWLVRLLWAWAKAEHYDRRESRGALLTARRPGRGGLVQDTPFKAAPQMTPSPIRAVLPDKTFTYGITTLWKEIVIQSPLQSLPLNNFVLGIKPSTPVFLGATSYLNHNKWYQKQKAFGIDWSHSKHTKDTNPMFNKPRSIEGVHHTSRMKDKNHMILIYFCAEKAFNKIKHPFMVKTLNKLGIKDTYHSTIKTMYEKPTVRMTLSSEKA